MAACRARSRGAQQYELEGKAVEGGGVGLCGEGKSILCSAGLRLLAGSTIPVLASCLASGQITRAKTIRAPRFRVLTNIVVEEGEAGKRRSEGNKKRDLKQANAASGKETVK